MKESVPVTRQCPFRPRVFANLESGKEVTDVLHNEVTEGGVCTKNVCNGSMMNNKGVPLDVRPPTEVMSQARQFLEEYYKDLKKLDSDEHKARLQEVTKSITRTGTYDLTLQELEFGAKLAWRNAPRCIGRISWNKLHLFDGRHVKTPKEMYNFMLEHLKYASNGGNLRSVITVFPQRRLGQRDFRVWNQQLLSYAGYEQPDGSVIGDPASKEFTKICQSLGWKGKGGRFDILPWVVSTPTGEPEWFEIPEEMILKVRIKHPKYSWFEDLEIEWFAVPAVSSMMLDCGGIQFTAAPFNGWYMSTEIGTRDLCDVQRYNMLPVFGEKLGLDMKSPTSLWKDQATLEVNIAVLHSFKEAGVTIVDHHTAAETFMQFHSNEHRQRGGCPADWVWIVPPISGSLTPVFHQEMSLYYLKPNYEYQMPAWIANKKQEKMLSGETATKGKSGLKNFRKLATAVLFTSSLYASAMAKRKRVVILYATETGKAQTYANFLGEIFSYNFNPEVISVVDYEVNKLSSETFVVFLASTTGVGEPPQNAKEFTKSLYSLRNNNSPGTEEESELFWNDYNEFKINGANTTSSSSDTAGMIDYKLNKNKRTFSRLLRWIRRRVKEDPGRSDGYLRGSDLSELYFSSTSLFKSTNSLFKILDPASEVTYAVFALGSTNYKYYCAYGKYIDHLMYTLGGDRIVDLAFGDETENQQEAFYSWASLLMKVCCERFHVENTSAGMLNPSKASHSKQVRIEERSKPVQLAKALSEIHESRIETCTVIGSNSLYEDRDKWYHNLVVSTVGKKSLQYQPGDHVGILPCNDRSMVHGILSKLTGYSHPDNPVQILIKDQKGSMVPHPVLPVTSVRTLLERFLDITTPPSRDLLQIMAQATTEKEHASRITFLTSSSDEYNRWKKENHPNLLEVLEEFPSVEMDAGLLLSQLPILQPRLYSISSSPEVGEGQLALTIASFTYRTQGGNGPLHKGVCTSYLRSLKPRDEIELYHKSAPHFHLPDKADVPILLIGAGSGVAPLRGLWQQCYYNHKAKNNKSPRRDVVLYYGCQTKATDLYAEEKAAMKKVKVLKEAHLALSRDPKVPKMYVQDLLLLNGKEVYKQLSQKGGHVYVCGSEGMAEGVYESLLSIFQDRGKYTLDEARKVIQKMKAGQRYHEDIFGKGSSS